MTGQKFSLFYIVTCPCISLLSISFDSDDDAVSTAFLYVIRDKRVYCASECETNRTENNLCKYIQTNIAFLYLHQLLVFSTHWLLQLTQNSPSVILMSRKSSVVRSYQHFVMVK